MTQAHKIIRVDLVTADYEQGPSHCQKEFALPKAAIVSVCQSNYQSCAEQQVLIKLKTRITITREQFISVIVPALSYAHCASSIPLLGETMGVVTSPRRLRNPVDQLQAPPFTAPWSYGNVPPELK